MSDKPKSMVEINRERYGVQRPRDTGACMVLRSTPRTGPSLRDYLRASTERPRDSPP